MDRAPAGPAGRSTAISETVDAPEREITRCASAMRFAMSVKNGDTTASIAITAKALFT